MTRIGKSSKRTQQRPQRGNQAWMPPRPLYLPLAPVHLCAKFNSQAGWFSYARPLHSSPPSASPPPPLHKRHILLQHRQATRSATFRALGRRRPFLSPLCGQILTGKPPSHSMETLTSMACARWGPVGLTLDEALKALLSRVHTRVLVSVRFCSRILASSVVIGVVVSSCVISAAF